MKSNSLNILLICKSLPWKFNGGIQTHVWELSRSLVSAGHKVTILTGGPYREAERCFNKAGVSIIEIPYFPGRYLKPVSMLAEELSFNLAAKKWVNAQHSGFDVIHAQGRSGYLLYRLSEIRKKLITTVHGLITQENHSARWYHINTQVHKLFSRKVEKRLIESSSQCLAVSQDLKSDLKSQYKQTNLTVIPNGVRLAGEAPLRPAFKNSRFLFVGRLHPVKGLVPLVKALAQAPEHIALDIIGDGPQYATIKRIIEKNNLQHRVRLLGAHSNKNIHKTLPFYQALVLPSLYETQGIVLIEANAQAIPVIASDISAIRETVAHGTNGLLCTPGNSQSFIDAMTYLTNHPEKAEHMGLEGRKRVIEQYSWDSIVHQTIATYHKLAG
ncbi:MAG: glycosyltransferase family 4 protein [Roseivirga sp.]